MPILNQQTGTVQEYEVIRFVTGTSTLHFSITNISEKCVRDKSVVTKGSARLSLCKMWSCFWTETPALLTRNKKCTRR